MTKDGALKGFFSVNDSQPKPFDIVGSDFYAGGSNKDWGYGAINNLRKISIIISFNKGLNYLKFYAAEANVNSLFYKLCKLLPGRR